MFFLIIRMFLNRNLNLVKNTKLIYQVRGLYNKNIVDDLRDRGVIKECMPEKPQLKEVFGTKQCIYAGFDPSSDSLHFGNLLVLITLLRFLRDGHKVICLLGSSTVRLGDPSDKDFDRKIISSDEAEYNTVKISATISSIFSNHYKYFWKQNHNTKNLPIDEEIILDNNDWYQNMNVIDFFSKLGKTCRLSDLLSKKFVQKRLNGYGLSFAEFSYQIFQGFDWLHLYKKYNCCFQIGGFDQQGNFQSGIHLIKRNGIENSYGICLPLLLDDKGTKYGKTSDGSPIWLDKNKKTYFDFYQFFLRTKDSNVELFLKLFTFYDLKEIEEIISKHLIKPSEGFAQKKLAEYITLLVHGKQGLKIAELGTSIIYKKSLKEIETLNPDDFNQILAKEQVLTMYLEPGFTTILDVAKKLKIFENESDLVRVFNLGGFYWNKQRINNPNELIENKHILNNRISLIQIGKKRFYIVKWQ